MRLARPVPFRSVLPPLPSPYPFHSLPSLLPLLWLLSRLLWYRWRKTGPWGVGTRVRAMHLTSNSEELEVNELTSVDDADETETAGDDERVDSSFACAAVDEVDGRDSGSGRLSAGRSGSDTSCIAFSFSSFSCNCASLCIL